MTSLRDKQHVSCVLLLLLVLCSIAPIPQHRLVWLAGAAQPVNPAGGHGIAAPATARLLCTDVSDYFCSSFATDAECVRNHTVGLELCKATCKKCKALALQVEQDTQFTVTVVHKPSEAACKDSVSGCAALKARGSCNTEMNSMMRDCPATCGFCSTSGGPSDTYHVCHDSLDACPYWATTGLCDTPLEWPRYLCPSSCGHCPPPATLRPIASLTTAATPADCYDYNPHCPLLADEGSCVNSYEFMQVHCRATCGFCSPPGTPSATPPPSPPATLDTAFRITDPTTTSGLAQGTPTDEYVTDSSDASAGQLGAATVQQQGGWSALQGRRAGATGSEGWQRGQGTEGGQGSERWRRGHGTGEGRLEGRSRNVGKWAVPPTGPECVDKAERCGAWAAAGGCEMSREVGEEMCRLACGNCDPLSMDMQLLRTSCEDKDEFCNSWAKGGQCESNPGYMLQSCGVACGMCDVLWSPYVRPVVRLNNGVLMPVLGFGTAGLGEQTQTAVLQAVGEGYRLIDSAQAREWYREDLVGYALHQATVSRNEVFITSKLHPRHLGYSNTVAQVEQSLRDLGTSYLDLFLLHYPECWGDLCTPQPGATWQGSWMALERLYKDGQLRAIGVSNFNLDQMQQLVSTATVKPAVLQANSDPRRPAFELQAFCRKHGIKFQAYSSLGTQWGTKGPNPVLTGEPVLAAAKRYNVSAVQVVLRWAMQHGQLVIPRSQNVSHMQDNLDSLFSLQLDRQTMLDIDGMEIKGEA